MNIFYLIFFLLALALVYIILKKEIKIAQQTQTQEIIKQISDFSKNEFFILKQEILQNFLSHQDTFQRSLFELSKNFGEMQKSLSVSLTQAQSVFEEIQKRAQDIISLKELFQIPKIRGNVGEFLLEDLLRNYLPQSYWEANYFLEGQIADFVIKLEDKVLVIDSKFPLESYKRSIEAQDEKEKERYEREFIKSVKERVNEIAKKYILPDKKTLSYAFMYIPAEAIYYWLLTQKEEIIDYCRTKNVIPVSPNILYAYLQSILLLIKGQVIEKNIKEVLEGMQRVNKEFEKLNEDFTKVGHHLKNAQNAYENSLKRLQEVFLRFKMLENFKTEEKNLFSSSSVLVKNENSN